jgi:hypothetical protein
MAQSVPELPQQIPGLIQQAARAYLALLQAAPAAEVLEWEPVQDALWRISTGNVLVGPFSTGQPGHDNGVFQNIGHGLAGANPLREYYIIERDCSRFSQHQYAVPSATLSLARELSRKLPRYRWGSNRLSEYFVGGRRLVIEMVPCIHAVLPAHLGENSGNCRVDHRPPPLQCLPHVFYTKDHYEHFVELSDLF